MDKVYLVRGDNHNVWSLRKTKASAEKLAKELNDAAMAEAREEWLADEYIQQIILSYEYRLAMYIQTRYEAVEARLLHGTHVMALKESDPVRYAEYCKWRTLHSSVIRKFEEKYGYNSFQIIVTCAAPTCYESYDVFECDVEE